MNFSTVAQKSGVARSFLYADEEVKKMIEEHRKRDVSSEINKRARFDKTAKSKDVIIETKDRRISALIEENTKLKADLDGKSINGRGARKTGLEEFQGIYFSSSRG